MKQRTINFTDTQSCIDDINKLRAGWRAGGAWSFPQVCWHLKYPIESSLREPASIKLTDEQRKLQTFIDLVFESGWPEGMTSPPQMIPPDPGAEAVDQLVQALQELDKYQPAYLDAIVFGPLETRKFRLFALAHAAHHLSFLQPTSGT